MEKLMTGGESHVSSESIAQAIQIIRGSKVMLSSDLAALYGVEPRVLVQAVKRNIGRFPPDFMFQLTREEWERLKSRNVISKTPAGPRSQNVILKRGQHAKYPPYAFTEQGVAMLSSVLRSRRAIRVNIEIMRAFVHMRRILSEYADLHCQLEEMERKYDARFKVVFEAIRKGIAAPATPKRRQIGFRTETEKSQPEDSR